MSKIFVADKLKIQGTKTLTAIALILILTVSAFMASMSAAKAQSTPPPGVPVIPTYAFITVAPNPVGVGQTVTVPFWLDKPPPTASGASGDRWQNMIVTVTKPDGTTQTLGPFTSDPVGSSYTTYAPDTVGTYYFQISFPGQRITGPSALIGLPIDSYYQSSASPKVALTVQQAPIASWPAAPLPTGYWTRPINAQNREWYAISGNWLMGGYNQAAGLGGGGFNPYTTAPNSAHIVWTKPTTFGGVIGGSYGGSGTGNYYTGLTYEFKFLPPVIMNGVLYYNTPEEAPSYGFYAVDLRTGQTLWWQNSTGQPPTAIGFIGLTGLGVAYPGITLGQIYNYISPNQFGGLPYLWSIPAAGSTVPGLNSPTWSMYDAVTGDWILNVANATGGTMIFSPDGSILSYVLDATHNWLAMWNSSKCIGVLSTFSTATWLWRPPTGATLDWETGIEWNVTVPSYPGQSLGSFSGFVTPDVLIATTGSLFLPQNYQMEIGYNAKNGAVLWTQNRTTPTGSTSWALMGSIGDGVYTEFHLSTMQWYGFDVYTGKQLWGPTEPYANAWGVFTTPGVNSMIAYGKLYASGYDGVIHAYDVKTGQHLWDYSTGSSGYETAYGTWPFSHNSAMVVADGKIYEATGHSHLQPLFRGAKVYCVDASTGQGLWDVSMWGMSSAIADGYYVTLNGYDNQIYCFGKGQTATTVTAPDTATPQGTAVEIRGTVTDQSPGAKGTPAISDQDMSAWMEYQYMQQPMPDHAAGVPVTLTAVDSNHNTINIGTTTSDNAGLFHIAWTPPATGEYTIIASFGGSNSYFASSAETGLAVAAAASSSSSAPLDLYIIVATIVIIIAIAIAVVVLSRRK